MGVGVHSFCHVGLFILLVVIHCNAKGDFGDFDHGEAAISPERIAQFYTETMVQSAGKEEQRCSENVFKARAKAKENGKRPSVGVKPTVGLGAALLIFLGVGIFAVGIAQAFQNVSKTEILYSLETFVSDHVNYEPIQNMCKMRNMYRMPQISSSYTIIF